MPRLLYNFSTLRKQIGGQRMKNRGKVGLREEWDWNSIFFFFEDEKQDEPSSFAFLLRFFEFYSKSRWKNSSTSFELIDVYVNYPHIVRYIGGSFPWNLILRETRICESSHHRMRARKKDRKIAWKSYSLLQWTIEEEQMTLAAEKGKIFFDNWGMKFSYPCDGQCVTGEREADKERTGYIARKGSGESGANLLHDGLRCRGRCSEREKKREEKKREKKKITLALELAMRLAYSCAALSRVFRCLTTTTTTTATDGALPTYS